MILIPRTPELEARALELATEVLRTATLKHTSYTGLPGTLETSTICYRGEWAVRQAILTAGRRAIYRFGTDGRSKPDEFLLYRNGVALTTDVKTASSASATSLLLPETQFLSHITTLYYFAVRQTLSHMELIGVVGRSELATGTTFEGRNHVLTRAYPYTHLIPAEDWLQALDAGAVHDQRI